MTIPDNFRTGSHSLTIAGYGADGTPFSGTYPIQVSTPRSIIERVAPWRSIGAAIVALVSLCILMVQHRRRAGLDLVRLPGAAGDLRRRPRRRPICFTHR